MREVVLRLYFEGQATASELAADLRTGIVHERASDGPRVTRYHVEDMSVDFTVEPVHVVSVLDAVEAGELSLEDVEAVAFSLEASDHFLWDTDTPEGERVAESLFWLGSPEINYPLTPSVLKKIRRYLLTGEKLLGREETRTD
ncbi:MAG TPA: hypothetical protein VHG51_16475 [Longimicrobiaceae bacterium]|nr:hypothetical protein [Longimicrobiaceae bacterium]